MLKPSLQLKLGQQLTMTPQLQQAIRLLQLPALELQAHIRELLERMSCSSPSRTPRPPGVRGRRGPEPQAETPERTAPESNVEVVDEGWGEQSVGPAETPWNSGDDDERQQEFADASGQSLQEHLLWQLELAKLEPRELAIARAIVDAISDDGYLTEPLEEIAGTLRPEIECDAAEVEAVLAGVQALDPPGVGARSVGECIELQLRQLDPATPGFNTAIQIARHHLELVAEREHLAVAPRAARRPTKRSPARSRWCAPAIRARLDRQHRRGRIRRSRCVRAAHRSRLGGGDQRRHPAAGAPQQQLREPHRPQRQPCHDARAAPGSALAAEEPGNPPRDPHQGRALHRRAADRPSSSTATSTCGR